MGQDYRTGEMHEIDHAAFKELRALHEEGMRQQILAKPASMVTAAGHLVELCGSLQEGEEVDVRGCRFRVAEIGRRFVILEGVPQITDGK